MYTDKRRLYEETTKMMNEEQIEKQVGYMAATHPLSISAQKKI